jgi:xyloglucan-specific exo-beta-1,4-glucanase
MYTNEWDPNVGSIMRTADKGNTWSETKLPFKVGGNMPGRGMGEVSNNTFTLHCVFLG